ncbi:hypothetical protein KKH82_00325, partial [Patescibacteria group bacterium]|nr:hypothetical protein [Patescibacteria group bacterium]
NAARTSYPSRTEMIRRKNVQRTVAFITKIPLVMTDGAHYEKVKSILVSYNLNNTTSLLAF